MEVHRRSSWLLLLLGVSLLAYTLQGVQGEVESEGPSESECRPYIEKALKELEGGETGSPETGSDSKEDVPTVEITTDDSDHQGGDGDDDPNDDGKQSAESTETQNLETEDSGEPTPEATEEEVKSTEAKDDSKEDDEKKSEEPVDTSNEANETDKNEEETNADSKQEESGEAKEESKEQADQPEATAESSTEEKKDSKEEESSDNKEESKENDTAEEKSKETDDNDDKEDRTSVEASKEDNKEDSKEDVKDSKEGNTESNENENATNETEEDDRKESAENENKPSEEAIPNSKEDPKESKEDEKEDLNESKEDTKDSKEDNKDSKEEDKNSKEGNTDSKEDDEKTANDDQKSKEEENKSNEDNPNSKENETDSKEKDANESNENSAPEEELTMDIEIPDNLRPRDHVEHLLKLDDEASETENIINRVSEITLRELKKLYENAIKPLEVLYKYRDLSNRHFGDAEIFSKPLILFMGPWSGGKSSIINYLLDNEYNETSLRTGAEPSPAYFNILMYGDEPEIVDGTELAADFTFSGLQKFGQGLEERLRGVKLPTKLLEKVNIVEIPGILEVRKQVSRVFPFNDACQWFIDRADIIFLVYDPSKLDVGPETEAILDQLKGREHQTRIILNKADQVKPEELMRVQGALIWNISPLMSSPQPPVMYTTSLWSRPYEPWAPVRLLQAQERAFLRDLRNAVDKRIENKIASARRFAVRVRNHAKMVDCYLTTYYNHKSVFGNRKQVADEIIEHPQDYHIYEGLSTLTNISRYDLPDPEVYKDFFKLNPLYDFQQLSATCTYFRGCPINRLDIAIAYDLPELVGTHKRLVESALAEAASTSVPGS